MSEEAKGRPVFVVLGATGGIGSEVCRRLAASGARLVVAGRDEGRVSALAEELDAETSIMDARHAEEVEACIAAALDSAGRIDGVANCVGSMLLKPAHLTKDAEWEETLAVNLTSSFGAVRATARAMKETGGSVVLVSSAAARIGLPNHEAIAAAKAGVMGLALAAAATYADRHIRFNVVAPGLVRTPLTERITSSAGGEKASLAMHPLGRLGEPGDVASAICWLLDPAQSWVTGQILGVDGGLAGLKSLAR